MNIQDINAVKAANEARNHLNRIIDGAGRIAWGYVWYAYKKGWKDCLENNQEQV